MTLFRAATDDDLLAIVRLYADDPLGATRETMGDTLDPAYVRAFRTIAGDRNHLLAVAEEAGEVVGTLQLSFIPGLAQRGGWRGQIEAVRVAAGRRGQGLGAAMIGWAVARCRERGCRLVQLTSDVSRPDAHRLYARLGFVQSQVQAQARRLTGCPTRARLAMTVQCAQPGSTDQPIGLKLPPLDA